MARQRPREMVHLTKLLHGISTVVNWGSSSLLQVQTLKKAMCTGVKFKPWVREMARTLPRLCISLICFLSYPFFKLKLGVSFHNDSPLSISLSHLQPPCFIPSCKYDFGLHPSLKTKTVFY